MKNSCLTLIAMVVLGVDPLLIAASVGAADPSFDLQQRQNQFRLQQQLDQLKRDQQLNQLQQGQQSDRLQQQLNQIR